MRTGMESGQLGLGPINYDLVMALGVWEVARAN